MSVISRGKPDDRSAPPQILKGQFLVSPRPFSNRAVPKGVRELIRQSMDIWPQPVAWDESGNFG